MKVGDAIDEPLPTEHVLPDDHPVHYGYFYVADGRLVTAGVQGTVRDLRRDLTRRGKSAAVVRKFDFDRVWR
jgi:hypothetical protein